VRRLDSEPKLSSATVKNLNAAYAVMYLAAHTTMPAYVRRSLNTRPRSRPIFLGKAVINFRLCGECAPCLVYEAVNAVISIFICWPEVVDISSKGAVSYTAQRARPIAAEPVYGVENDARNEVPGVELFLPVPGLMSTLGKGGHVWIMGFSRLPSLIPAFSSQSCLVGTQICSMKRKEGALDAHQYQAYHANTRTL
jgi:hypothetical protein